MIKMLLITIVRVRHFLRAHARDNLVTATRILMDELELPVPTKHKAPPATQPSKKKKIVGQWEDVVPAPQKAILALIRSKQDAAGGTSL